MFDDEGVELAGSVFSPFVCTVVVSVDITLAMEALISGMIHIVCFVLMIEI